MKRHHSTHSASQSSYELRNGIDDNNRMDFAHTFLYAAQSMSHKKPHDIPMKTICGERMNGERYEKKKKKKIQEK